MTTEVYDVSQPGSLFSALMSEPDLWKVADAKLKLAIAEDWNAVGSPMPQPEEMQHLSRAERSQVHQLVMSLGMHAKANRENELAALNAQKAELAASAPRKASKEIDIKRDGNGKLMNVRVYK
jgi:hypothetical protein